MKSKPEFIISIAAHEVQVGSRTIPIPYRQETISSFSHEKDAKLRVLSWAHADANVPAWKPCLRQSWEFTTAVKVVQDEPASLF